MLFDKFQEMANFQTELAEREVRPFGAVTEEIISATEGVVDGRETKILLQIFSKTVIGTRILCFLKWNVITRLSLKTSVF